MLVEISTGSSVKPGDKKKRGMFPLAYLLVWSIHAVVSLDIDTDINLSSDLKGCLIENPSAVKSCTNRDGVPVDITEFSLLQKGNICIFEHEEYPVVCQNGMITLTAGGKFVEERIVKRKKRILPITLILYGGGIACYFLCGGSHQHSTPNRPPVITKNAALKVSTPIFAPQRKSNASVYWDEPVITDPEQGTLRISTSPSNYRSGGEYTEGSYKIYFKGTDDGGLSASDYLMFEVKVYRCEPKSLPKNGNISCNSGDMIYGTLCTVSCKSGFYLNGTSNMVCQKNGSWSPESTPYCKPKACRGLPNILNGRISCINNKMVFGNDCEVVCDEGFRAKENHLIGCDSEGHWGALPTCKDILPPTFLRGKCPDDMQVYIDSSNNTATVTWEVPRGTDNSKEPVIIKEEHGYVPGQRFKTGSHVVNYSIEDQSHNKGDCCNFSIEVLTISCEPPNLFVPHLVYECPESYRLGASCSLRCKSGYPLGGANQIHCKVKTKSYPPAVNWKWNDDSLKPFCKGTNCSRAALSEPLNGALACDEWTHGQMCQMQCESGYDIPNIGLGFFVCGRSDGKWRPTNNVPDCNVKMDVTVIHLPSKFYYYTGHCNSSVENLRQIKENFVLALNTSQFYEECRGVPDCRTENVNVTCGSFSGRHRRDVSTNMYSLAYEVQFEIAAKFQNIAGKSIKDVVLENKERLYNMSDIIQKEFDKGLFNLNITDTHVNHNSYSPGQPVMKCPPGTTPRESSATCVGCPKGSFMEAHSVCEKCPVGTYQNNSDAETCIPCPEQSNTTGPGSDDIEMCLGYCTEGQFSQNGLTPCVKCPVNSYQPNMMSTKCIRCMPGTMTLKDGATSTNQCIEYDVRLTSGKTTIRRNLTFDSITLYMWIYRLATESSIKRQISVRLYGSENSGPSENITMFPVTCMRQNGSLRPENIIPFAIWTSVVIRLDIRANVLSVYKDGKYVCQNPSIMSSNYSQIQTQSLEFNGDVKVSSLKVIPRKATMSEISSWSSTCKPNITGEIMSMDDIVDTGLAQIIIPSVCDDVDECANFPCGSHKCINIRGGFKCECEKGFTGSQCNILVDLCEQSLCQNNATCVMGNSNYSCQCPYGYSGAYCQVRAVDGAWSYWSGWTGCSKTCANGIQTRTRRCDSPPPNAQGKDCNGNTTETRTCNMENCPECLRLTMTHGLRTTCNTTTDLKRCTVSCEDGLYFPIPPLPYYECGVATGYKWNHQTKNNPTARLPSCTEIEIPKTIGVSFEGHYTSIPCSPDNIRSIKGQLERQLTKIECLKDGICEIAVLPKCHSSGQYVSVVVSLKAPENYTNWGISVTKTNGTTTQQSLVDFGQQVIHIETSAKYVMNNSAHVFVVKIAGTIHSLSGGEQKLSHESSMRCEPGTIPKDMFCVQCPPGTYNDGVISSCKECRQGYYQKHSGQSTCKQCPFGTSTIGTGSTNVLECKNVRSDREDHNVDGQENVDVKIAVGVSVPIAILLFLSFVAIYLINRRRRGASYNVVSQGQLNENWGNSHSVVQLRHQNVEKKINPQTALFRTKSFDENQCSSDELDV